MTIQKMEEVIKYLSELFNVTDEVKDKIGTLVAETYQEGWSSGHKVGRDNATSVPVTSNVTTDIQDEVMAAIRLEYDSVLRLLTPHLNERQRIASTNAFGEAVRPAVAKAISSAWSSAFRCGAEHERKACLDAIDAAAANRNFHMPTVEHGGVRAPIPTILDRDLLKHRVRWRQWPNVMRHEYVQARLYCGKPCVQLVVNGEYKGIIRPDGAIIRECEPTDQFSDLALKVALADAREKLSPEGVGETRVPDSRVGMFLFVDSKGNEFELKNTDYGTVIVKGEVVLGKVYRGVGDARGCSVDSSETFFVKHTECALRMCEDYGALTRSVFSFCRWACDPASARPNFMLRTCDIEGHIGFRVRLVEGGAFEVVYSTGGIGARLTPDNRGTFSVLSYYDPFIGEYHAITNAAVKTIRSKFYGNMA